MELNLEAPPLPLAADAFGVVRVGGTRIPLDTVITAFKQGSTPEQIVDDFDTLHLADVYAVIGYYLRHQSEVEAYLEEQRRSAEEIRRENERRFPPHGIRERLLARRAQRT
jgi:uncharacterized protein (DUF433 family)